MEIIEYKGDVLKSKANLILHQVNAFGVMGGGLARQVREQYPKVNEEYVNFVKAYGKDRVKLLGQVQYCYLDGDRYIGNVFGQLDCGYGECFTDYNALEKAFKDVSNYAIKHKLKSIAIPKYFGCGLAGGDWTIVSEIIIRNLIELDITLEIVEFGK